MQGARFSRMNPNHPHAHGFTIRNINPTGSRNNCAATAIAADDLLGGIAKLPAQDCPLTGLGAFERIYGQQWQHNLTLAQLESQLAGRGSGCRAIIYGHRGNPAEGHFFNAVNQGGKIRFLCGQGGGAIDASAFVQGEMSIIWTQLP